MWFIDFVLISFRFGSAIEVTGHWKGDEFSASLQVIDLRDGM